MTEADSPLDDLSGLLDAERSIDELAPARRARMVARLEAALPLPSGPGGGGAPPTAVLDHAAAGKRAASVASAGAGKVLIAAASLVVGVAVGAAGHAAWSARDGAEHARVMRMPVPVVVTVTVPAPEAHANSTSASVTAPTSMPSSSASPPAERPGDPTQLQAERLLLEAAQTALSRGDHEAALAALRRHARTFPRGQLVEEREVMMVRALRAAGDDGEARRRAAAFKDKFPSSLMQGAVDEPAAGDGGP